MYIRRKEKMTELIVKKMYYTNRGDLEPEISISYLILHNNDIDDFFTDDEDDLLYNGQLQIKTLHVDKNSDAYRIAEHNRNLKQRGIPQEFIDHLIQQFKDSLSN